MKIITIFIALLTFFMFSANLQAKPGVNYPTGMNLQHSDAKPMQLARRGRDRHRHRHRHRDRLFWITGAAAAAAIAAGAANAHRGNTYECRVWYRGRHRYGIKKPGRPCLVRYHGQWLYFDNYQIID